MRSGLLRKPYGLKTQPEANRPALDEFLRHGLRYAFPIVSGGMVRGIPTSYAAEPLSREFNASDEPPPVWPWEHGEVRGLALEPLYRTVPDAATKDEELYRALAVADGMRDQSPRVRAVAGNHLADILGVSLDAP